MILLVALVVTAMFIVGYALLGIGVPYLMVAAAYVVVAVIIVNTVMNKESK